MKKFIFISSLVMLVLFSMNLFSQNLPDDWTGDSGIDTYQESSTIHGGTYSCKVLVNTATQGNCDFSSNIGIPVNEGDTYTISFWAYTSDYVRVTGLMDWDGASTTYNNTYVGPATGGWSQFSYSDVVPAGATAGYVRLRFYDVSGFVPGEIQYIDDVTFESPSGNFLLVTNGDMESWTIGGDPTEITAAYSISDTEIDVWYDQDITSVDPNDYELTGSQTLTFASASIDPGNAKLVHLTANGSISADFTLDNLYDDNWGFGYTFYAGITPIAYLNTTNPSGTIQDGYTATFTGIISANDAYNNAWISDNSGAYNGVMLYSSSIVSEVAEGDEVLITGERGVYAALTEIVNPVLLNTLSTGNSPFGPSVIDGSEIEENNLVDTNPGESWEGQLVTIENFTVESLDTYEYTCSWSDGSTTYYFHVGDNVDYHLTNVVMNVGETYVSITGVVDWDDYDSYYRINPRYQSDVVSNAAPQIIMAYAISDTEVDIMYDNTLSSVDPDDYQLTGSQTINFSAATIDGTDPSIVHLTASQAMTGDNVLDNIWDDNYSTGMDFYAGILPIAYTNTTNPGGIILDDYMATFEGIVFANDEYNNVWISDASGAYNGLLIFDYDFPATVVYSDNIMVAGTRTTYSDFVTELTNPILIDVATFGSDPYDATVINGSDIEENIGGDTDPAEMWEGQLVTIENFTVESFADNDYVCSWSDDKATYYFHVGDNVDYGFGNTSLTVGASYVSITGVIDWDYYDLRYRINPRNQDDIVDAFNPAYQLAVVSVNGGMDPQINTPFEVIIQSQDINGDPTPVDSDINITLTTNGGNSGTVVFTGTTTGVLTNGFSEVTITGVIMEPVDTDVTITANDDASVLIAGTSSPFDILPYVTPDIIITEIMQNPAAVDDAEGEWFEVFNTTSSDIDLLDWIIADADNDRDTIHSSVIVPAMGFAVLGNNADNLTNGDYTCNYQYAADFYLSNSADEIILMLPNGTEVNRVEYDGGPVWPDPSGASMVFTGTAGTPNNDGILWVTAESREPSYVGTEGDLGSPGSNGEFQHLIMGDEFYLDIKVFLEGPFNGTDMNTDLNEIIPLQQTLGVIGYNGTEEVDEIPNTDVVDWIGVELRDAPDINSATEETAVAGGAFFLLKDGSIVALDGSSLPSFDVQIVNQLFVVIWHRNHLPVASNYPLSESFGTYSYDFTTSANQAFGDNQSSLDGVFGMIGGNLNADNIINNFDLSEAWQVEAGNNGYYTEDGNMDTEVDNKDKDDLWYDNQNMIEILPE